MLSSVSGSITGVLYNFQLMKYAGENGVAAYGVVMYAAFIFLGIFNGYSQGSTPIVGYHYGAQNYKEIKSILKRSLIMLGSAAVLLTESAVLLARSIASVFIGYDVERLNMTAHAFVICAILFLVMWFNMYTSSFLRRSITVRYLRRFHLHGPWYFL